MPLSAFAAVPLLASLVLAYRADPGTVYVAADSRFTSSEGVATAPDDSACKIRVLKDGVVFAGSGDARFSNAGMRTDIYAVAASAAATLPLGPVAGAEVRRVALSWQAEVHARLLARLAASGEEGRPAAAVAQSTTGTTGAFYAAVADGSVYGITLRVALDADGTLRDIEEPAPASGYLVATGTNAAKRDALAIAAAPSVAALQWPRRLRAIEVETIRAEIRRYGRRSEIGGPVDVIAITSRGPVWLARKPRCR